MTFAHINLHVVTTRAKEPEYIRGYWTKVH